MGQHSPELVLQALRENPLLSAQDCEVIAGAGLPIYTSLVLGHLKAAGELLDRDAMFSVEMREEVWHNWRMGRCATRMMRR